MPAAQSCWSIMTEPKCALLWSLAVPMGFPHPSLVSLRWPLWPSARQDPGLASIVGSRPREEAVDDPLLTSPLHRHPRCLVVYNSHVLSLNIADSRLEGPSLKLRVGSTLSGPLLAYSFGSVLASALNWGPSSSHIYPLYHSTPCSHTASCRIVKKHTF